jgi:hypothetical protein
MKGLTHKSQICVSVTFWLTNIVNQKWRGRTILTFLVRSFKKFVIAVKIFRLLRAG